MQDRQKAERPYCISCVFPASRAQEDEASDDEEETFHFP